MAYQETVARWLFSRRETFDLKINEFRWGKALSKPVYDFEASISLNGKIHIGRGTDAIEILALEKACAEAIERLVCESHGIATDGVALHKSQALARRSANREATERFLLRWHQSNREPFRIQQNIEPYMTLVQSISASAEVQIGAMNSDSENFAPVCLIAESNQLFIGMAMETNLHAACERAVFEALRNLAAFKNDSDAYLNAVATNKDLWCGRAADLRPLVSLFSNVENPSRPPKIILLSESLSLAGIAELEGCPVFVERSWEEGADANT